MTVFRCRWRVYPKTWLQILLFKISDRVAVTADAADDVPAAVTFTATVAVTVVDPWAIVVQSRFVVLRCDLREGHAHEEPIVILDPTKNWCRGTGA